MLKIVCIELDDDLILEKEVLYYALENTWTEYSVYDYDTTDHLGYFPKTLFGTYKNWLALQRNKKINSLFDDVEV